ncbi:MAG: glycosyltransferase family 4 protein [Alphaproteobacteria bacterium]|nr:glycosyltransferase family 4 protein [Alphaproteobacteria bacterium]
MHTLADQGAAQAASSVTSNPQIWLDVEDLFQYAVHNPRPSGIQRLCYELYSALVSQQKYTIKFCRHDANARILREVSWADIRSLFLGLSKVKRPADQKTVAPEIWQARQHNVGFLRNLVRKLPVEMREPIAQAYAAQRIVLATQFDVFRYIKNFLKILSKQKKVLPEKEGNVVKNVGGQDIRDLLRSEDIFCVLGSPWFHKDYAALLEEATQPHDKNVRAPKIVLLIYDLIPILRPEWCDAALVACFTKWFETCIPRADFLFAISEATAADLTSWMTKQNISVPGSIEILPIGCGFIEEPGEKTADIPANLAKSEFVLFVSTIEARKNHLFVFRVWRRLLAQFGPDKIPTLVFAGRQGWLVADLMQQLKNCSFLDGKIAFIPDPSDSELRELYKRCRFTIFPSLYEGWGLPVTESLAFGKVCVASNRTSIPEAGGEFCLYFDPENVSEAAAVISKACFDNAVIEEKENLIRAHYKPTSWLDSANILTTALARSSERP